MLPVMGRSTLRVLRVAVLSLLIVGSAAAGAGAAAGQTCDLVASTHGSDQASGSIRHPFATPSRLVASLGPGQTGCLRGGVYRQDVTVRRGGKPGDPIALRSYPGERATIIGRIYLARGAAYTTISHLKLVGLEVGHACASMCPSPTVNADHTTFVWDDVTNDHADVSCFLLGDSHAVYGPADDTTIEHDRIHNCGKMPPTNYDHGIYIEESHGSKIVGNAIYDNADRGVQLYPQAIGTLVFGNVIDNNGEGLVFGASGPQSSDDNVVAGNIIINSRVLYNVAGAYGPGDRVGTGNVVRGNCIGGGPTDNSRNPGGVRFNHAGFRLSDNRLLTPKPSTHGVMSVAAPASVPLPVSVPGTPSALRSAGSRASASSALPANPCHGMKTTA